FVGAMVGLERTVLPLLAREEFGVASSAAVLSFVASFGLVKATTNLAAGHLADRFGRRLVLVLGWIAGLPVPFLIIWAPSWGWIVAANALLGVNQGLAWSMTVVMKIDLVGPERRGLAAGLNEFAGYTAAAVMAYATGEIAVRAGLRPEPFYLGIAVAAIGLALSVLFVRETRPAGTRESEGEPRAGLADVFGRVTWRDSRLQACSQAGLVNNLNDGVAWALFPVYFASVGMSLREIGILAAVYPGVWGIAQLGTGPLGDRVGRPGLVVSGLLLQAVAIAAVASASSFRPLLAAAVVLGLGTALVYPTLLAAVSDLSEASWRASALGVYRFWRDAGYAVGALGIGAFAALVGDAGAIRAAAVLTAASGLIVWARLGSSRALG
ncbi:MAG: MFS transporter, partial [Gemmatimonadota bacterium]